MKNNKINAMVVLAKCSKTGRLYGNRVEKKNDGAWHFTWSFEINDLDIKNEKYNETSISGKVVLDDSYKGCPYCGTVGWFTCGECSKLTCNDKNTGEKVSCKWCGNTAELGGDTDDFKLKGGSI